MSLQPLGVRFLHLSATAKVTLLLTEPGVLAAGDEEVRRLLKLEIEGGGV